MRFYLQGHAVGDREDGSAVGGVMSSEQRRRIVVPRTSHVTIRVDEGIDGTCGLHVPLLIGRAVGHGEVRPSSAVVDTVQFVVGIRLAEPISVEDRR